MVVIRITEENGPFQATMQYINTRLAMRTAFQPEYNGAEFIPTGQSFTLNLPLSKYIFIVLENNCPGTHTVVPHSESFPSPKHSYSVTHQIRAHSLKKTNEIWQASHSV